MARANGLAVILKSYLKSLLKGHAWKKGIGVERRLELMYLGSDKIIEKFIRGNLSKYRLPKR